ncbi:MAG TPA: hypothetical protein VF599_23420 [Pyrinomonadaceae bacterium]|jgi:hypothetical protein
MMNLFLLRPEVAGGWGSETVVANRAEIESGAATIAVVTKLEYVFDDWLGDDLLESFPCFIVTETLAEKLKNNSLSGLKFSDVLISVSELFEDINGVETFSGLPAFVRLEPQGKASFDVEYKILDWSGDDFCLGDKADLIVTEKALGILKEGSLDQCDIISLKDAGLCDIKK